MSPSWAKTGVSGTISLSLSTFQRSSMVCLPQTKIFFSIEVKSVFLRSLVTDMLEILVFGSSKDSFSSKSTIEWNLANPSKPDVVKKWEPSVQNLISETIFVWQGMVDKTVFPRRSQIFEVLSPEQVAKWYPSEQKSLPNIFLLCPVIGRIGWEDRRSHTIPTDSRSPEN